MKIKSYFRKSYIREQVQEATVKDFYISNSSLFLSFKNHIISLRMEGYGGMICNHSLTPTPHSCSKQVNFHVTWTSNKIVAYRFAISGRREKIKKKVCVKSVCLPQGIICWYSLLLCTRQGLKLWSFNMVNVEVVKETVVEFIDNG